MNLRGNLRAVTIWTSILDLSMFAINGLIAVYLARRFGPEVFSQYLLITSFISVFSLFTRGIQTSIAQSYPQQQFNLGHFRLISNLYSEKRSLIFGFRLSLLWLIFVPFLNIYGHVSLLPALSATVILPTSSLLAVVIGRLQGSGQFFRWRLSLLLTTSLQVPIILVAAYLKSPLSVFILILAVPSFILSIYQICLHRPIHANSLEENIKIGLAPGGISVLSMAAIQLPLIYVRHKFTGNQSTPLLIFIYSSGLFIGISSTLGSFLLPDYDSAQKFDYRKLKTHLLNMLPMLVFLALYFPLGSFVIRAALGPDFTLTNNFNFSLISSISFLIWGVYSSLIHERLNEFKSRFLISILCLVFSEFLLINIFDVSINEFFCTHAVFGLLSLFAALLVTK